MIEDRETEKRKKQAVEEEERGQKQEKKRLKRIVFAKALWREAHLTPFSHAT